VAAVVAAVAEPAIDRAKVGSRRRFRVRRVLSAGRRECSAGTAHPDPPPQGGRETCAEAIPPGGRPFQGLREIYQTSGDGGGGVGGVDAARDRTLRQPVAARRVAAHRQANTARAPEFAGIEWTSGALP